jgi:uncharacterized membrane protein
MGAFCSHFLFLLRCKDFMQKKTRFLAHAAMIGALYATLTHLQNILLPGSATWAIQFRVSEALCVLALYSPTAIAGLSIGCLLFNLSYAGALPLDFVLGTGATLLATAAMWLTRNVKIKGFPLLSLLMPAIFNALLVGWELSIYIGGAFWLNAAYVAIGELAVLFVLGSALYYTIRSRHLDTRLFGK